jgi:hypothetical protein
MLQEYPITRTSRRCHVGDRPLNPGERYYSALVMRGDAITRIDISAEHWRSPPENCVGWWRCRMPLDDSPKLRPAPAGVLLDSLTEIAKYPEQSRLAYLLALLLMRRKVLTEVTDSPLAAIQTATGENSGNSQTAVFTSADGRQWEITVDLPTDTHEAQRLQESLVSLLFSES